MSKSKLFEHASFYFHDTGDVEIHLFIRVVLARFFQFEDIVFASEAKNLVGLVTKITPFPPGHFYADGKFVCYRDLTDVKEYVKEVKAMAEEAKIALRNVRQDANNEIKKLELPEDEEKRGMEEVQDLIGKYNKEVDNLLAEKEKELMTV